ncbi:microtubule associated-domain-containing protein [Cunninghamella echinulata]|nr:microtubule associated-domain-containing protein [Cunninghamella echinulata]
MENHFQEMKDQYNGNASVLSETSYTQVSLIEDTQPTIDILRKENFGLKMKIYYLEKRLDELSPDQNDNAIRENIDLKVNIQTLSQELKKYKKMILELNNAISILQQEPRGMSEEEQLEYQNALASADAYKTENDQLKNLISDQRMENARLRVQIQQQGDDVWTNTNHKNINNSVSSNGTSGNSSVNSSGKYKEMEAFKNKYVQAKQTIQEQNEIILRLRSLIKNPTELNQYKNIQNELELRNADLTTQLRQRIKELEEKERGIEELSQLLHDSKQDLNEKCLNYEVLEEKYNQLKSNYEELHENTNQLQSELDQREQEIMLLEEQIIKVVNHAESLEKKKDSYQTDMNLHHETMEEMKQQYEHDLQLLEVKFQQVEQSIRERDVRIASLEGNFEAQQGQMEREKQIYQEEIKDLEEQIKQLQQPNEDVKLEVKQLQKRLQEADHRLKRDRKVANQALHDYMNSQKSLSQKLEAISKRNELLTSLLNQYQHKPNVNSKTRLLAQLNQELHHELEERDRLLEKEIIRAQQLDELYTQSLEELKKKEQQLIRRDNMMTKTLERIESDKERKEVLENILRRQVTDDLDDVRKSFDSSTTLE